MALTHGHYQPQSCIHDAHKSSHCDEQKPEVILARELGSLITTSLPPLSATRGETDASSLPTRTEIRLADDRRSATQIYKDNPMLGSGIMSRAFGWNPQRRERQTKLIKNLKRQVGDFTSANPDLLSRANAMYRLARVINHIDRDPSLRRVKGSYPGDGHLDVQGAKGFPSEVDRLTKFGEQGYRVLQEGDRKAIRQKPVPQGRMPGDLRTVEEITLNPLFNAFEEVFVAEELAAFKVRIGGDWEDSGLPADVRADIAANAEHVLTFIDQQGGACSTANDGKIDGRVQDVPFLPPAFLTREHFTYPGSEARRLSDFAHAGYSIFDKR